jgi:hypothetical protein
MQDLLSCVDLHDSQPQITEYNIEKQHCPARPARRSPPVLIVESVHNLDGLFHFLLPRRTSVEDRTIRTGTKDVLEMTGQSRSRRDSTATYLM